MPASLSAQSYGKCCVRVSRIGRVGDRHDFSEFSVDLLLDGDFEAAYTEADNRLVIATDSMKNTIYVLAREAASDTIEAFGSSIATHFLNEYKHVTQVTVRIEERFWERLQLDGSAHPHTFIGGGSERRVATISQDRKTATLTCGIKGLTVLKTTDSGFENFLRDRFTTLPETADRILGTTLTAEWGYQADIGDWGAMREQVRQELLRVFAEHPSRSVQDTLFAMANAVLERCSSVSEITLEMPNQHHIPANLTAFGLDNPNMVFVPTDEPFGVICATVTRDGGNVSSPSR